MVDIGRLKESWRLVAGYGDQVPLRFYSRLFVAHPEVRDMFPLSMATQRDRFVTALGQTVSQVDDLEALTPYIQRLARDHRKFGIAPAHFGPVGEALLATLADFLGEGWTQQLADDWTTAYQLIASVMIDAAETAALSTPPWWDAEIVAHEHRTFDIAVITVRLDPTYGFAAGQSVPIETELRPRVWRHYSPANAPRADNTLELHVRRVPGGQVSSALVDSLQVGDHLRVGAPMGDRLTLDGMAGAGGGVHGGAGSGRNLLLVSSGTGLAPLKALIDHVANAAEANGAGGGGHGTPGWAAGGAPPQVTLVMGARTTRELYDLPAMEELAGRYPWLTLVPAVADPEDPLNIHAQGEPVEVALEKGGWTDHDIFVCGSDEMVAGTLNRLHQTGCAVDRLRWEGFQGLAGEPYGVIELHEEGPR
jgi:NAD(P)H-flavin reductase/hemoglobin-like flavoprotein